MPALKANVAVYGNVSEMDEPGCPFGESVIRYSSGIFAESPVMVAGWSVGLTARIS